MAVGPGIPGVPPPGFLPNPAIIGANHLFPPGPCEIAVGTGGDRTDLGVDNTNYEFLGTTREGGRAQEILYSGNIPADYSGSDGMPADMRLSGKGIVVVFQMQNFNPWVMRRVKARYWGNASDIAKVGRIDGGDIGCLLIQEFRYIPICIRSLNAYKYPTNEYGLWLPTAFPSGEMGWDYAAREQVYNMTFMGVTYMNMTYPATPEQDVDPHNLGCFYNQGILYSTEKADIERIWAAVTNPPDDAARRAESQDERKRGRKRDQNEE